MYILECFKNWCKQWNSKIGSGRANRSKIIFDIEMSVALEMSLQ
jgi:hypothetical protein